MVCRSYSATINLFAYENSRMTNDPEEHGLPATGGLKKQQLYGILLEEFALSINRSIDEIDLDKTFDDYGLDSIDGVLMTGTIGERLNIDLPPELLMQYRKVGDAFSAIASLAGVGDGMSATAQALPQVYLFAGGAGRDGRLATLAQRSADTIDGVFILPGNWQEWVAAGGNLETIVTTCCDRIAMLSPQGSLRLAGYSQGGQLAFASAVELIARGRQVDLVILIDSPVEGRSWRASTSSFVTENFYIFLTVLLRSIRVSSLAARSPKASADYGDLGEVKMSRLSEVIRFIADKKRIVKIQSLLNSKLSKRDVVHFDNYLQMQYFDMAWEEWISRFKQTLPSFVQVWLLKSEDEGTIDLGWRKYCKNLHIHQLRGTHSSIFDDENLPDMISTLNRVVNNKLDMPV